MTIVEQTREMIARIRKLTEENFRQENEIKELRLRIQAIRLQIQTMSDLEA